MVCVKICGVRTEQGAQAVITAKADFAGLLMVEGRSRSVTPQQAKKIAQIISPVKPVLVVQNKNNEEILRLAEEIGVKHVQLHGEESVDTCALLKQRGLDVIKAVSIKSQNDVVLACEYLPYVMTLLLDSPFPGEGKNWNFEDFDLSNISNFWLAGGLNPWNVAQAITRSKANGVDVASGVETNRQQDVHLIHEFVKAARSA